MNEDTLTILIENRKEWNRQKRSILCPARAESVCAILWKIEEKKNVDDLKRTLVPGVDSLKYHLNVSSFNCVYFPSLTQKPL